MGLSSDDIARIVAIGTPVLCLDTCSILDVMRDPTRDTARADEAEMVKFLLDCVESDGSLIALIADQVALEFDAHVDAVEQEGGQALAKLVGQIDHVDKLVAVHGAGERADVAHWSQHIPRVRALADRWISAGMRVPQGSDIPVKALNRLNQARAPAKKGKDSMKDCVVIETYMDAIGRLRSAKFQGRAVFLSSNVKDYAGESRSHLRPELVSEFSVLAMEYAPNFGAAKHLLGL